MTTTTPPPNRPTQPAPRRPKRRPPIDPASLAVSAERLPLAFFLLVLPTPGVPLPTDAVEAMTLLSDPKNPLRFLEEDDLPTLWEPN